MAIQLTRRGLLAGAATIPLVPALREGSFAPAPVPPPEAKPEAALPPINAEALAKRMARTLAPSAGEKAILFFDPGYYPEIAAAIEQELASAGVEHFLAASFDPPEVVQSVESRGDAAHRQEEYVSWLAPAFAKADLFLWLPVRAQYDDVRLERLVGGSTVRGIHFHWILDFDGINVDQIRALSRSYENVILHTDYAALSRTQERLVERLRGKRLRFRSPDGTDLTMELPADAWFHRNDGDMSPARAKSARCARDRSMELPAGALRFIPAAASVEGRLVVRRVPTPHGPAENVVIEFQDGRARSFHAAKGEDGFRRQWGAIGGDIDEVGEIVLGTNPLLTSPDPAGRLAFFGYGAGAVRVSLGDNWESGGSNRTPRTRNWWLFLADASLDAGDAAVLRDGKLVEG